MKAGRLADSICIVWKFQHGRNARVAYSRSIAGDCSNATVVLAAGRFRLVGVSMIMCIIGMAAVAHCDMVTSSMH